MRIYVSGPMTGKPGNNIAAFNAAAKLLREAGHFVINPAELSPLFGSAEEIAEAFRHKNFKIEYCSKGYFPVKRGLADCMMAADFAALGSCDAIYLLIGWRESRGAIEELREALRLHLRIFLEGDELPAPENETTGVVIQYGN